jgi:hypothetical protein
MKNFKFIVGLLLFSFTTFSCEPDELVQDIVQEDQLQNEIAEDSGEVKSPIDDKKN